MINKSIGTFNLATDICHRGWHLTRGLKIHSTFFSPTGTPAHHFLGPSKNIHTYCHLWYLHLATLFGCVLGVYRSFVCTVGFSL